MSHVIEDCSATELRERVDWDGLDEVAVVALDSEGRRHVYSSTGDYRALAWLSRHLDAHISNEMARSQEDVS